MSVSRRNFVRALGLGTTALSTSLVPGLEAEAQAFGGWAAPAAAADLGGITRLSNNENNRGPGPKALAAVHDAVGSGMGRGYPPDHVNELADAIAAFWSVGPYPRCGNWAASTPSPRRPASPR